MYREDEKEKKKEGGRAEVDMMREKVKIGEEGETL